MTCSSVIMIFAQRATSAHKASSMEEYERITFPSTPVQLESHPAPWPSAWSRMRRAAFALVLQPAYFRTSEPSEVRRATVTRGDRVMAAGGALADMSLRPE